MCFDSACVCCPGFRCSACVCATVSVCVCVCACVCVCVSVPVSVCTKYVEHEQRRVGFCVQACFLFLVAWAVVGKRCEAREDSRSLVGLLSSICQPRSHGRVHAAELGQHCASMEHLRIIWLSLDACEHRFGGGKAQIASLAVLRKSTVNFTAHLLAQQRRPSCRCSELSAQHLGNTAWRLAACSAVSMPLLEAMGNHAAEQAFTAR